MFIIQTREGTEHFSREGNFVVGGNIGAAVANCGREAYGAASLGVCTGAMPLESKTNRRVVGTTMKASRRRKSLRWWHTLSLKDGTWA